MTKSEIKPSLIRLRWVLRQLKLESFYGNKALSEIYPFKSGEENELRQVFKEINKVVLKFKEKPDLFSSFHRKFMELRNISGSVNNLKNNQTLGETEFFEIKNFAILVSDIIDLAQKENILPSRLSNFNFKPVIELLNPDKIITRSFYIHEKWSEKLELIRKEKKSIENQIVSAKDDKEKDVLRLKRAEIVNQERDEELIVRKLLTDKLKAYQNNLDFAVNNIGILELILAKAELAFSNNCCIPVILESDSSENIIIKEAIEPEVAESLKVKNRKFTPVTIDIQKGVTLLTGANMGGKTIALKTIALNTELARFGFLAFAKEISLKIPDFVEVIAGDLQDADNGLSSFGAEIVNLTEMLKKIDSQSGLAICDELGRSTNPYEGSRFVQALSDKLQQSSSFGIIATHYDGIKSDGAAFYQVAGLKSALQKNADKNNISRLDLYEMMDYHLIKTTAFDEVPHEALNIGILLGLPKDFVESLEKYYK